MNGRCLIYIFRWLAGWLAPTAAAGNLQSRIRVLIFFVRRSTHHLSSSTLARFRPVWSRQTGIWQQGSLGTIRQGTKTKKKKRKQETQEAERKTRPEYAMMATNERCAEIRKTPPSSILDGRIAVDLSHRYLKATNGCKASIRPVIESDQIYGKQSVQLDWCVCVSSPGKSSPSFPYVPFTTLQHRTYYSPPPNSYCWPVAPAQLLRNNASCPEYTYSFTLPIKCKL
jgi:hypothetical protein